MGFRIIFIENEAKMSLKLDNLIINKGEGDIWIPLDDISMVVIDNLQTTLSARMLSVLAQEGIGVVITDQKHNPIGIYGAYDNHSRVAKTIKYQIQFSKDLYDDIWAEIVRRKIENQKEVLKKIMGNVVSVVELEHFSREVVSGDITNREAHAAKIYFNTLMGQSFSRGNEDILLNSGLDFGYAIVRSFIARACVGYGMNTQIGIHHKNEYNRFNLVDDLIEPLRPFVDLYAYFLLESKEYFMPKHRHQLVNILNHKVFYNNKNMFLSNMIEEYVEQYASFLMGNRECILLPDVNGYEVPDEKNFEEEDYEV